jgi:hypothetical protein
MHHIAVSCHAVDFLGEGQLSAKAACCQASSGAIVDDPAGEVPAVILGVEPIVLTPQQAEAQPASASAATACAATTMAGLRVATGGG